MFNCKINSVCVVTCITTVVSGSGSTSPAKNDFSRSIPFVHYDIVVIFKIKPLSNRLWQTDWQTDSPWCTAAITTRTLQSYPLSEHWQLRLWETQRVSVLNWGWGLGRCPCIKPQILAHMFTTHTQFASFSYFVRCWIMDLVFVHEKIRAHWCPQISLLYYPHKKTFEHTDDKMVVNLRIRVFKWLLTPTLFALLFVWYHCGTVTHAKSKAKNKKTNRKKHILPNRHTHRLGRRPCIKPQITKQAAGVVQIYAIIFTTHAACIVFLFSGRKTRAKAQYL